MGRFYSNMVLTSPTWNSYRILVGTNKDLEGKHQRFSLGMHGQAIGDAVKKK